MAKIIFSFLTLILSLKVSANSLKTPFWSESFYNHLRETAPQFWSFYHPLAEKKLSDFTKHQGWILGDPHPLNFSIKHWEGKNYWVPFDFDDSGKGPFVLDLIRLHLTSPHYFRNKLTTSYIQGLKNEDLNEDVSLIKKVLAIKKETVEKLRNKYLRKHVKNNRWDRSQANLGPVPRSIQKQLIEYIKPLYPIDFALYVKDHGGSKGVPRYWVLSRGEQGRLVLVEFKQLVKPAVAYYQANQSEHKERINSLKNHYWKEVPAPLHNVVNVAGKSYLQRLREVDLMKKFSGDPAFFKTAAIYNAYKLGRFHASQSKAYVEEVVNKSHQFKEAVNTYSEAYLKDALTEFRGRKKHKKLSIIGDLNIRAQSQKVAAQETETKGRMRARLKIKGRMNHQLQGVFQLTLAKNATSTHESLGGDEFDQKPVFLNQSYLNWSPAPSLKLLAGKFENPNIRIGKTQLIWDSNISPEGLAFKYFPKQGNQSLLLGAYVIRDRFDDTSGHDKTDLSLINARYSVDFPLRHFVFTLSGGWFHYLNMKGAKFKDVGDSTGSGNSAIPETEKFLYDYEISDVGFELTQGSKWQNWGLFAQWAHNHAISEQNNGYYVGGRFEVRPFEFKYGFTKVEKDAVVGALSYSAPAYGGTDLKAHVIKASYRIMKNFKIQLTHFIADQNLNDPVKHIKTRIDLRANWD